MKTYTVKIEYRDSWSNNPEWNGIVTDSEIAELANEWGVSVDELLEQIEEA